MPDATPARYVLGIAHQAGRDPRIGRGADGRRDYFEPETLEKAAWRFMGSAKDVGTEHVDGTTGQADVVESYIYRGPDWDLGDGVIVKSGDWLVGAILDEPAWNAYQRGEFTGWSIQGRARRRQPLAKSTYDRSTKSFTVFLDTAEDPGALARRLLTALEGSTP